MLAAGLLLALFQFPARAQTIRVTTWNVAGPVSTQAGASNDVAVAAKTLKELNPDLVLLQGVRDWQMCTRLAQALKPATYHVAVCSAFPAARTNNAPQELAILAKQKAYFSWSEPWRVADQASVRGGYVFAAVQFGAHRLGCFSLLVPELLPDSFTPQQLLDQAELVRRWEANRVGSFLIGGTDGKPAAGATAVEARVLGPLGQEGFGDVLGPLPQAQRITFRPVAGNGSTADWLLVDASALALNPRIATTGKEGHLPITCEVELDPAKVAAARAVLSANSLAKAAALNETSAHNGNGGTVPLRPKGWITIVMPFWWAAVLLALAVIGLGVLLLRTRRPRRRTSPALIPATFDGDAPGPAGYTVVVATGSVTGSAATPPRPPQPVIRLEAGGTTHTESAAWQRRALAAEQRADRAHEAIRRGVVPHFRRWLKQKFAQQMIEDRSQLLATQQAAANKALAVDERLARIEAQIREQNEAYQQRVEELTRELAAAKEENRELIRARIAQIKLEMEAARAKLLAQAERERQ